jgi:hypothetical protein
MTLVHLAPAADYDSTEIVELLENALKDARAGKIRTLVMGTVDRDGEPYYSKYGRNELELEGLAARVWRCIAEDGDEEQTDDGGPGISKIA